MWLSREVPAGVEAPGGREPRARAGGGRTGDVMAGIYLRTATGQVGDAPGGGEWGSRPLIER